MGLLRPDARIELAVPQEPVPAGARFSFRVDVLEVDDKVRSGKVVLGYEIWHEKLFTQFCDTENCSYQKWGSSRYHDHEEPSKTTTWWAEAGWEVPVAPGRYMFEATVPRDAPLPSPPQVEWFVKADVDRERGRDVAAKAPLHVVPHPQAIAPCAPEPRTTSGQVPMTIEPAGTQWRSPRAIEGRVVVSPVAPITTRGIRARLVRVVQESRSLGDKERHSYPRDRTQPNPERHVEAEAVLTGEFTMIPGRPFALPIQVPLQQPRPCFVTPYNSQHWFLEVVVDVPWGSDDVSWIHLAML